MSDPRWQRLWSLFEQTLALPAERRADFVAASCPEDPDLAAEVRRLIDAHLRTSTLLDELGAAAALGLGPPSGEAGAEPARIGPYRLERQIGAGGMGVVYAAEQEHPLRRRVALKLIRLGMATRDVLARFDAERRALALMEHPNIARVLDAGATATGRPYFAMELVEGMPIDRWADEHRLTLRQRIELFVPVCRAVQHAHQKGIVHRDLKPSNLLVHEADGRPLAKVIDFGIARALSGDDGESTRLTTGGGLVGTLDYMSPEQIDPERDVDTRSDVYSLGVVLYELLAGTLPRSTGDAAAGGPVGILRRLSAAAARPLGDAIRDLGERGENVAARRSTDLRSLRRELRGDLDRIVRKAVAFDRSDRYTSASELALDLERFLRHEPVAAAGESGVYRLSKFVARHRLGVAAMAVLVLLLAGFTVTSTLQAQRIRIALADARTQAARAESVAGFLARLFRSSDPRQTLGIDTPVRHVLERGAEEIAADDSVDARTRATLLLTLAEVYGDLGEPARAETLARESLEIRRRELGDDDPETLSALNDLGVWIRKQERFDEARALLEEAYARRQRTLGPSHPDTLASAQNLATMLIGEGRLDEGIELLQTLLERQSETFGTDAESTMTTVNILAIALQRKGRQQEAEPLVRRALDYRRRTLGPDDPSTLTSWSNLGVVLKAEERDRDAAAEFRGALEGRRRVLGPEHASTLTTAQNLAATLTDLGELEEAEAILRPTLDALRRTLGPDHSLSLICAHNLARVLLLARRYDQAEALERDNVERADRNLPASHSYRGLFRSWLGAALAAEGRKQEARLWIEQAVAILDAQLGPDHAHTHEARERLAAL